MTKTTSIHWAERQTRALIKRSHFHRAGLLVAAVLFLRYGAAASPIPLGTAGNFAVLAGSAVTSTGPTVVDGGDIGVSPGSAVTGFPPGILAAPYTFEEGTATAAQAETDLTVAYNDAAGLPVNQALTGQNLGGLILTPGVYFFSSAAQLTGTLTLNDEGNPNAQFVFQIGSTLTTAANSSIVTINSGGAAPGLDVFWQVGSSATLGTGTDFEGNILANASITADTGASDLDGRLLAENGSVTLDANAITVPPPFTASAPDTADTLPLLACASAALMSLGGDSLVSLKDSLVSLNSGHGSLEVPALFSVGLHLIVRIRQIIYVINMSKAQRWRHSKESKGIICYTQSR